jgi:transposase
MSRRNEFLTDTQWARIEPLLPKLPQNPKGGRPWADSRRVLEGILWVLKTGARWRDLPERYPSPATCWRRLRQWEEEDVWVTIWRTFLGELDARGRLGWEAAFIDASFFPAKKGAPPSEKPSGAGARSAWWWSSARVYLLEFTLPRRPRRKSRSSRRRSPRSASPGRVRGGHARTRSG